MVQGEFTTRNTKSMLWSLLSFVPSMALSWCHLTLMMQSLVTKPFSSPLAAAKSKRRNLFGWWSEVIPADELKRIQKGIPEGVIIVQSPRLRKVTHYTTTNTEVKIISDAICAVIENVFGKLKEFHILCSWYPHKAEQTLRKVITVVCVLVAFNMQDRNHYLHKC